MEEKYMNICDSIKPNAPTFYYPWYYVRTGDINRALEEVNKRFPTENQFKLAYVGDLFLWNGEYDSAVQYFQKWEKIVNTENPDNWFSISDWHRYGQALVGVGDIENGRNYMRKQITINRERIRLKRDPQTAMYDLAGIYSFLEEPDSAFYWLNEFDKDDLGSKLRSIETFILVDPQFDNIRGNPRFIEMLRKVNANKMEIRDQLRSMSLN
jgi:tetratricopeptide (TPR) repeat protein